MILKQINKETKINLFIIIIIIGFLLAVFYHYFLGVYLGLPYPSNTFLFIPSDRFNDFFDTIKFTDYAPVNVREFPINEYGYAQNSNYLPGTFLVSNVFRAISIKIIRPHLFSLLVFIVLFIAYTLIYSWKNLQSSNKYNTIINTIVFTFFTYPVLIVIDRANFEVIIFILLSLFVYYYQKGKASLSIIPLALAISIKLYPVVFLLLFISDRKYKLTFSAIILSIGLIIFPLLFLMDGGFTKNYDMMLSVLQNYNTAVSNNFGLDFGHSLFGLIKLPLLYFHLDVRPLLSIWPIIAVTIMFLISLFILVIEQIFWKKVTLIIVSICLLPYVSADYKLILFFIPIFLFINYTELEDNIHAETLTQRERRKKIIVQYNFAILFALLLIPKGYRFFSSICEGVYLNPIIMLLLSILIIHSGIDVLNPEKKVRIRKIKKVSFYVFLCFILVSIMLVVGGGWFMFTPKGNEIVKGRLTNYLTKRFNTTVHFDSLRFSTKDVYADLNMVSVAKVHFDLKSINDSLSGNYKFDIIDANKISKRFGEKFGFSTSGKISGSGINNIKMDGATNIFRGSSNYHIEMVHRKVSRIGFELNDIHIEDVLSGIIKKGDGIAGKTDISGDVLIENLRPTFGDVRFFADSLVVDRSSTFIKFFGLSLVNNTNVRAKIQTTFDGKEAVSKININSGIGQITMLDNRIDLKSRGLNSDYLIEVSNLKDIVISDSSKVASINNQLPNLKKLKSILSEKCDGEILIEGRLNKNNGNFGLNGHTFDFLENKITKENFKSKSSSFRLENNIVHVNDSTYKN